MRIAIISLRRTFLVVLVVLLILGGAVGCGRKLCEVVVVNEAPSLGLAQRYFVELVAKVNLARTADGDGAHAWRIVIRETRTAREEDVLAKEWVDFEVMSPGSNNVNERCLLGFDKCLMRIVEKLPEQCRLEK
jgi:hypothetical protein